MFLEGSRLNREENSTEVPLDFDKKWGISDLVIRTEDANGKDLHVNKAVMATFSPYFRALFFSDFAEKLLDSIDVEVEYEVMKEVLRIIHSVNRNYGQKDHKLYSAEMLAKLYQAADRYDFPSIRDLCRQQFVQIKPTAAFELAVKLDLQKEKSEILKKMSLEDIQSFLREDNESLVFSPNDVAQILVKSQDQKQMCSKCKNAFSIRIKDLNSGF